MFYLRLNEDRSKAFNNAVSDFATSQGGYDIVASPTTLKVAIQEFLVQQNVAVTSTQLEQIIKETLELMAHYNTVSKQIVESKTSNGKHEG